MDNREVSVFKIIKLLKDNKFNQLPPNKPKRLKLVFLTHNLLKIQNKVFLLIKHLDVTFRFNLKKTKVILEMIELHLLNSMKKILIRKILFKKV